MIIAESQLKQLVYEEVMLRVIDDLVDEELFRFCLENSLLKESEADDIKDEWNKSQSFRQKVRNVIDGFELLPKKQRIVAIIAMGVLGAAGTKFAGDYAERSQASAIAKDLRIKAKNAKEKYTVSVKDLSNFRDAASDSGAKPIDPTDSEGIQNSKKQFLSMGADIAPINPGRALSFTSKEQNFVYTPADNIPDNQILPFVGMKKSDWEKIIRTWLQSPDGQERLKKWTGAGGSTSSVFWAYGPKGGLFSKALDNAEEGSQGLWLPPEWSVAYDVLQKNISRAGYDTVEPNPLSLPMDDGDMYLKKIIRKSLHNILHVL